MKRFKQVYEKEKKIMDISRIEKDAIKNAHKYVGEWLNEKGTTNLRELSVTDQYEFMAIVFGNVSSELSKLETKSSPDNTNKIPF